MMRRSLASVLALVIPPSVALADECLRYNTSVEVTGYYGSVVFPGGPEFSDVRKGDERYVAAMLFLGPTGPCITADPTDDLTHTVTDVSVIHLACSDTSIYRKLDKLQGSPVTIRGKLFNADNARHKAAVLLGDCELVPTK